MLPTLIFFLKQEGHDMKRMIKYAFLLPMRLFSLILIIISELSMNIVAKAGSIVLLPMTIALIYEIGIRQYKGATIFGILLGGFLVLAWIASEIRVIVETITGWICRV